MEQGYVYVLTNPSFKEDWVKIGKSKRLPEVRSKELYNTSIPLSFDIYATLKTVKYSEAEKLLHNFIKHLAPKKRINSNREFFNIHPEKVYELLNNVKNVLGEEASLELHGDNIEIKDNDSSNKVRGEIFDFYKKGLKENDIITFIDDSHIQPIVANNRQVYFEGEKWYLSALVKEIYSRRGNVNNSGAYQGPAYFEFNGIILKDLPNIKKNSSKF